MNYKNIVLTTLLIAGTATQAAPSTSTLDTAKKYGLVAIYASLSSLAGVTALTSALVGANAFKVGIYDAKRTEFPARTASKNHLIDRLLSNSLGSYEAGKCLWVGDRSINMLSTLFFAKLAHDFAQRANKTLNS